MILKKAIYIIIIFIHNLFSMQEAAQFGIQLVAASVSAVGKPKNDVALLSAPAHKLGVSARTC